MKFILKIMPLMWFLAEAAHAVVIIGGDGSGNTTAPADDPGFANIGTVNGDSCVYLGNGWVLTAEHVVGGSLPASVQFGATSYSTASGTLHQLTNNGTTGMTTLTDMVVFQLTSNPNLPALSISSTPTVGQSITMIGNGVNRTAGTTYWDSNWNQLPSSSGASYSGFQGVFGSNSVRWGTNTVGQTGQAINDGIGDVYSFSSSPFNPSGGPNEAQAITGDSGGAAFVKNGSTWELAGMIYAVNTYNGQPGTTAVYGDETAIADLSFYSSQIDSITGVPEPSTYLIAAATLPLMAFRRRR